MVLVVAFLSVGFFYLSSDGSRGAETRQLVTRSALNRNDSILDIRQKVVYVR